MRRLDGMAKFFVCWSCDTDRCQRAIVSESCVILTRGHCDEMVLTVVRISTPALVYALCVLSSRSDSLAVPSMMSGVQSQGRLAAASAALRQPSLQRISRFLHRKFRFFLQFLLCLICLIL
jgi:hypothetical protein